MRKKITLSIIAIIFTFNSSAQRMYEDEALEVGIESINEFRKFLSLKNDANKKDELEPLIQWGIDSFENYGFKVERLETPELPPPRLPPAAKPTSPLFCCAPPPPV